MSEIRYTLLSDFISQNPDYIETIKDQYLLLLSELTSTSYIEKDIFLDNVDRIHKMGSIVVGLVNDEYGKCNIVASGTIIIEPKIIREGRNVGHIEDVVVSNKMRGKGICKNILDLLKTIARENNCYKVILDCTDEFKDVYIKNGLHVHGVQMAEYFHY
jgi:glucosamine-phosphate N-acetyltransferase